MSVQSLQKKRDSFKARLSVCKGKSIDLQAREAALKAARGDALAEGADVSAINAELINISSDLSNCTDEIDGLKRATKKLDGEIKTESERESAEQREKSLSRIRKLSDKIASRLEGIDADVNELAETVFQVCWTSGGLSDAPLTGSMTLKGVANTLVWNRVHYLESQVYAGTRSRPVVDQPPVFEVEETPGQRLEHLQTELRETERMLPGLVEYRDRCTLGGFGSDKVGKEKLEKAEKAVIDTREQITRLKDEIKKDGTPK